MLVAYGLSIKCTPLQLAASASRQISWIKISIAPEIMQNLFPIALPVMHGKERFFWFFGSSFFGFASLDECAIKQNSVSSLLSSAHVLPSPSRQTSPLWCRVVVSNFPGEDIVENFFQFETSFQFLFEIISQVLCLYVEQSTQEAGILMMVGELLTMSTSFFEDELIGITAVLPVFLKSFVVFFFPSSKCSTETKREARGVVI